jgi:2-polyprenyl-3-methyl-5-hydroxy-6-metoxy-1,4-benzoquinol methylase
MPKLKNRSYQLELLDAENIPFKDIKTNMKELNTINTYLGGHAITIAGLKKLITTYPKNLPLTICEIGCGGGDNLQAVYTYCLQKNIDVHFIGIDIQQACIDFAKQQYPYLPVTWLCNDYKKATFIQQPNIIFSSLFCHHFIENDIIQMLQWMKKNSTLGFFINDLHRHCIAYYSIKIMTAIFSTSYLVKNDAPLSVARGFKKNEWQQLFTSAAISNYQLKWKWAFRHLIIFVHGNT